eukprot:5348816-Pyramimonas_sp.AAC.1
MNIHCNICVYVSVQCWCGAVSLNWSILSWMSWLVAADCSRKFSSVSHSTYNGSVLMPAVGWPLGPRCSPGGGGSWFACSASVVCSVCRLLAIF